MPFWSRHESEAVDDGLWLIIGLGNPGRQYADTRHNIGFMVVEALAKRHGLTFRGSKLSADVARGTIAGVSVLLAQPLTFMNESGSAVSKLLHYYRADRSRMLIVCDDIDLPFGTLRLRARGSSGGQRGLESVIRAVGSEVARLKLGIGRPHREAVGHVLGRFPPSEAAVLPRFLDVACNAVEQYLVRDTRDVMNDFNRDWLPALSESSVQS